MARRDDTTIASNSKLYEARRRTSSPTRPGRCMTRSELADAVNAAMDKLYPDRMNIAVFYVDEAWIGKLERGQHHWSGPERRAALRHALSVAHDAEIGLYPPMRRTLDLPLATGETLTVKTSATPEPAREVESAAAQELRMSVVESASLLAARLDDADFGLFHEAIARLGKTYVEDSPFSMLKQGLTIRRELLRRMSTAALPPDRLSDFYVAIGRASGVAAYAALDLGDHAAAAIHGEAVWRMADLAGDNELRAWGRGTQSLIARFNQEFVRAQLFAEEGLRYAPAGPSRARLICAAAQCAANQGDAERAFELIADAETTRAASDDDGLDGIFGFPLAKQKYYAASSLMWLPDRKALRVAAESAAEAIALWQRSPGKQRLLDDEALAYVYLATVRLKLGDVDEAMEAVAPVMELPMERRTSWMRKRVANLRELLSDKRFKGLRSIAVTQEQLYEFEAS